MTLSVNMENKPPIEEKQRTVWNKVFLWCSTNSRAVLAELLATASLIFFGCLNCLPILGLDSHPPMYAAIGFGFAVIFNVQIFGHISGAHMNPAVTVSSIIWGSTSIILGIVYIIAQCIGAILGYYVLSILAPVDVAADGICVTAVREGLGLYQAFVIEMLLTAALCMLCCGLWDPKNRNNLDSAALKFGFAVSGLSLAGGHLTGCSMNPARSLGPALVTGRWTAHYIYWIAPILGGSLATFIYKYIWLEPFDKPKKSEEESLNRF